METKEIEKEYNFSDFTTSHYRDLIRKAKEKNYIFSRYHSFDKNSKFVLWRHDIDLSPHRALRLAQIENEEGVFSTYFIHLHSEYYNPFEKEVFNIIKQIIGLGHDIGVHFDAHFYDLKTEKEIETRLLNEKQILENLFSTKIHSFSFHFTNPFVLSCTKWMYAGLINAYADYFKTEVTYCSDSNGYWRFQRMMDVIEESNVPRLHLLTHPEWWQEEMMSPWQKIKRAVDGRALRNREYYRNLLSSAGMKNIDWNGEIK